MIHTTIGYYPNGTRKTNGVSSENISSHIWYNLNCRPGRAFFVDGFCLNIGNLSKERCDEIESEIKDFKITSDTKPYQ